MKLSAALFAVSVAFAATPTLADHHGKNIVETAVEAGSFTTLIAAAKAAGLAGALAEGKDLTVFAPTDDAFADLPAGTVEQLLKPENKDKLVAILSYHVVPSKIASGDLKDATVDVSTLKTEGDNTITVTKSMDGVMVDGAKVIKADVMAGNGVIHVINKVMLPSD